MVAARRRCRGRESNPHAPVGAADFKSSPSASADFGQPEKVLHTANSEKCWYARRFGSFRWLMWPQSGPQRRARVRARSADRPYMSRRGMVRRSRKPLSVIDGSRVQIPPPPLNEAVRPTKAHRFRHAAVSAAASAPRNSFSDRAAARSPAAHRHLVPDPYFSATKLDWLLARTDVRPDDLAFGTVDSWLVWKLTNGRVHATDLTNTSRRCCSIPGRSPGATTARALRHRPCVLAS
jgi:hypothetical protein